MVRAAPFDSGVNTRFEGHCLVSGFHAYMDEAVRILRLAADDPATLSLFIDNSGLNNVPEMDRKKRGISSMVSGKEPFGAFIRPRRKEKEIGLREIAKMIGASLLMCRRSSGMNPRHRPKKRLGRLPTFWAVTLVSYWRDQARWHRTCRTSSGVIPAKWPPC